MTNANYIWYPKTYRDYLLISDKGQYTKMDIPLEFLDTTVFLEKKSGGDWIKLGSAFVIGEDKGDKVFTYLVTCWHVIQEALEANIQLFVSANLKDERGVEHIPIKNKWVFHKDNNKEHKVDLAVLPLESVPGVKPTEVAAMDSDLIYGQEGMRQLFKRNLQVGDDILFIGLFEQLDFHYRVHPLVRFGRVSLIPEEEITGVETWLGTSDYFLVECQAYPGMSGSPVIVMKVKDETEKYFLVGIMAGYFREDKKLGTKFTHYGISQVIPVNKLGDIIWGNELNTDRENKLRDAKMKKRASPAASKAEESEIFTEDDMDSALKKAFKPDTKDETSDEEK